MAAQEFHPEARHMYKHVAPCCSYKVFNTLKARGSHTHRVSMCVCVFTIQAGETEGGRAAEV